MFRVVPLLLFACKAAVTPAATDVPTPPSPTTPLETLPCPSSDSPFGFASLGQPLFATPPNTTLTRTYTGRVTVPLELDLDLTSMWLLDQQVMVTEVVDDHEERYATYEVMATCTTCDHASMHIGSLSSNVIFTAPTDPEATAVIANFSLVSTSWMALGISSGSTPTIATPIAFQQRPDLNPFLADTAEVMAIDIMLRNSTGVSVHGNPIANSEVLFGVDDLLADPNIPAPAVSAVPWLLPVAQAGQTDLLVTWGPRGRSAGLSAVDGRFLVDLPLHVPPADMAFRTVAADGRQSRSTSVRYPPDAGVGRLDLRVLAFEDPKIEVLGPADSWTILRVAGQTPTVCRSNLEGRTQFPLPAADLIELAVLDPQTLMLLGHTICTLPGGPFCR